MIRIFYAWMNDNEILAGFKQQIDREVKLSGDYVTDFRRCQEVVSNNVGSVTFGDNVYFPTVQNWMEL